MLFRSDFNIIHAYAWSCFFSAKNVVFYALVGKCMKDVLYLPTQQDTNISSFSLGTVIGRIEKKCYANSSQLHAD